MSELQPHQQRVVDEKKDLDEKIAKLDAFGQSDHFESLPHIERAALMWQRSVMDEYSRVLRLRISMWEQSVAE